MTADIGTLLGEILFLLLIFAVTIAVCIGLLAAIAKVLGWGRTSPRATAGDTRSEPPAPGDTPQPGH